MSTDPALQTSGDGEQQQHGNGNTGAGAAMELDTQQQQQHQTQIGAQMRVLALYCTGSSDENDPGFDPQESPNASLLKARPGDEVGQEQSSTTSSVSGLRSIDT